MQYWLVKCLSERERAMYRIAMRCSRDPQEVDDLFFRHFVIKPERVTENKRECSNPNSDNK